MFYVKQVKPKIYFIGQNSHGSDESWAFRTAFIQNLLPGPRSIVLVECPTIDLIMFSLRRFRRENSNDMSWLRFSTYWWMRSDEFARFLSLLPDTCDIVGIDLPLSTAMHEYYIKKIQHITFPEQRLLVDSMMYDQQHKQSLVKATPDQRETIMADKVELALKHEYDSIIVICHNFHATRLSWLYYSSLCQMLIEKYKNNIEIVSIGVFAKKMSFLATPDGHSLVSYDIDKVCNKGRHHEYYVKMISSLYRSEALDALNLVLTKYIHFDEIVIFPDGKSITMEIF